VTIGFIDNDILLKLVAFRLFEEAVSSFEIAKTDLRFLPTAKFMFLQLRRQQKTMYTDDILQRVIAIVESCQTIADVANDSESRAEAIQLDAVSEIHLGEARLILATRREDSFLLMSGDKNCMRALSQLPDEIYDRLCGRVVCLEQVVLKMIDVLGFDEMCDRIYPAVQYDKSIHFCFGYSKLALEPQVRDALQSCIDEIHTAAPGLLAELG